MLTPASKPSLSPRQGRRGPSTAEIRGKLEDGSDLTDSQRVRLLALAEKLRRLRAMGGDYDRVELSRFVALAMERQEAAV